MLWLLSFPLWNEMPGPSGAPLVFAIRCFNQPLIELSSSYHAGDITLFMVCGLLLLIVNIQTACA
jgi:hypothetical protein